MGIKRKHHPLTVIDLFAGVGGFSLGFSRARGLDGEPLFDIRLLVDSNKEAAYTFKNNFPSIPYHVVDVRELQAPAVRSYSSLTDPDIVIGGPPCQGFSMVGKRTPNDDRNDLPREFLRLVRSLRPKIALMENVPSILGSVHKGHADFIEQAFLNAGYLTKSCVLHANDFGVPQLRRRAFIMGVRRDLGIIPEFPIPTNNEENMVTVEQAIGDLPSIQSGDNLDVRRYLIPPITEYQKERRRRSSHLFNHVARNHSPAFLKKISIIPEGGGNRDLSPELQFSSNYFSQAYARLTRTKPAYTITTQFLNPGCGRFIHYRDRRSITPREAARFQSFDDDFIFHGTLAAQERQIGNAVPPLLALALAQKIARLLKMPAVMESKGLRSARTIID